MVGPSMCHVALFISTLRHSLRNPETQSNFHVWTEGKQIFLQRIHTKLFSRCLMCWLFFVCPIAHQIRHLPSLFFSMTCDMTSVNCITKTPLPWPSVWFVQWEALVGDPKAIVENCLEFSPIQMWCVLLNFYRGTLGFHFFF